VSIKLQNANLVGFEQQGDELVTRKKVDILINKGKIVKVGTNLDEGKDGEWKARKVLDIEGALVTPGFVDPHTHLFPPRGRADEFAMRSEKTYQEIKEAGGGIRNSMKVCRDATFDEIYATNAANVKRFILQGTQTLEMKSGYGLNTETEIKLLRVIQKLK
jgi:imidazolonepropionase